MCVRSGGLRQGRKMRSSVLDIFDEAFQQKVRQPVGDTGLGGSGNVMSNTLSDGFSGCGTSCFPLLCVVDPQQRWRSQSPCQCVCVCVGGEGPVWVSCEVFASTQCLGCRQGPAFG